MANSKRPFENRHIFKVINTEEKAYWLGFLYADGSVGSTDNRIELGLAEKDVHHIEKFKNFIGLNNKISYREKTKSYRYCFKDEIFKSILIQQGCVPNKSLILQFPTEEQVPDNLMRHFVRGYFDGDGHFTNTSSCFEAGFLGTESFIRGFLKRAPNCLNTTLSIKLGSSTGSVKKYAFYSYNDVKNFLNFMYEDCSIYLDRKYEHYLDFINNGSNYHHEKNYI